MSPAASTARPDIAITLRWTSRSIPAMPIAESSAPIVVGIRQTSSATRTDRSTDEASEYSANGRSVTTASRKIMVSPASRMSSAISFGVLLPLGALDERDHPVEEATRRVAR